MISFVGGVYTVGLGQGSSVTKGVSGANIRKKRMEKKRIRKYVSKNHLRGALLNLGWV
jgi:hypothetical protein